MLLCHAVFFLKNKKGLIIINRRGNKNIVIKLGANKYICGINKRTMRTIDKLNMSPEIVKGEGLVTKADLRATIMALLQIIGVEEIVENTVLSGTTMSTCQAFLSTGLNVVTSASESSYAIKLPNPPKKGTSSTIVNTSGFPIVVYPSVEGGSINGTINGSAIIPSDGKPYVFYCWENPLPGAWTWTPPAINQYDSGEITINTTSGNNVWSLLNPSMKGVGAGFNSDTDWGYDCLNTPLFRVGAGGEGYVAMQRPSPYWNNLLKIKVYTNLLLDMGRLTMGLTQGSTVNLYTAGTLDLVDTATGGGAGNYGNGTTVPYYFDLDSMVPGTPSVGALSANIGDAGTLYTVRDYSLMPSYLGSGFGNIYLGQQLNGGVLCDRWLGRGFQFQLQPRSALTGLKIRFFIEYN